MGEPVLLGRARSGEAYALRDICPHRAAPLSAGRLVREAGGDEVVECPYHGWRFRTGDGVCSAIPSKVADQEIDVGRIRVRRYPIAETQGLIFVWMTSDPRRDGEPDHPAPTFPGIVGGAPKLIDRMVFEERPYRPCRGRADGPRPWSLCAPELVVALSRLPARQSQDVDEPREAGFAMVRHPPSKNSYAYRILGGAPSTEIVFRVPGLRWEHIEIGKRQVLSLTCLTPETENRTRITQVVWSDHPILALLKPFVAMGARKFLRQDAAMVNLQNQGLVYDPALLWVDDADRQAKWYQALKREWTTSRKAGRPFVNPVEPGVLRWRS